jgi:hypothetical protein
LPLPRDRDYWNTFDYAAIPRDSDHIVDCSMPAGYFMLFDDLLHNSFRNSTALPRLSLAARYARPDFPRVHELAGYQGHACVMVSGKQRDYGTCFVSPPDSGPSLSDVAPDIEK